MSHFIAELWGTEWIQWLFWLSFSIRYFHVFLATEKRASSIKPDTTNDNGEKCKGEVEDLWCRV